MKKIAFLGTHGTGKTILTYQIAAEFRRRGHNVEVLKEVARESPLPINEGTTLAAQQWILFRQMALEIECAARSEMVICDRSVLDNYAYLRRAVGAQPTLERLVAEWMATYDEVIHVPILAGEIADDGVRSTDRDFQREIDENVKELLGRYEIPYRALPPNRAQWGPAIFARFEESGLIRREVAA